MACERCSSVLACWITAPFGPDVHCITSALARRLPFATDSNRPEAVSRINLETGGQFTARRASPHSDQDANCGSFDHWPSSVYWWRNR